MIQRAKFSARTELCPATIVQAPRQTRRPVWLRMKIAVINFASYVGKTTVARHLLLPRIEGAELLRVRRSISTDRRCRAVPARRFGALQEYLHTLDSVVVDIDISECEELLRQMHMYRGSHEDFDCFVVPAMRSLSQQRDTIATLFELAQLGVDASRIRLVFNGIDEGTAVEDPFDPLMAFIAAQPIAQAGPGACLSFNPIYEQLGNDAELATLAHDPTDFITLIARATTATDKLMLARTLGNRRLARGVLPELEACFAALALGPAAAPPATPAASRPAA